MKIRAQVTKRGILRIFKVETTRGRKHPVLVKSIADGALDEKGKRVPYSVLINDALASLAASD